MRKGFTLIEILIGALIGIIIVLASTIFFSYGYRLILNTISNSRSNTSIFQVEEIINSDLRKAGYGIEDPTTYPPVEWNLELKKLIIRYVDYEKDDIDCENETFGDNNTPECDYIITYQLKNNNLYRFVDKGANGNSSSAPMFDGNLIKIEDFFVSINNTTHAVEYAISGTTLEGNFTIGDTIICRNWK
ncbi:hypothetical protein GFV12_05720 [Desulfurobacterium thermolithotrophum]|uniref:hypothetical protein n=1 Tax=Desulfurobacterium thermolithotrophum TaxID=64160 RepID=UPI0013D43FD3|nr:hypothetical protein [Desulfurobacterium thermolithotrophum]